MKTVKNNILLVLGLVVVYYLLQWFLAEFNLNFSSEPKIKMTDRLSLIRTLISKNGWFSVDLPAGLTMYEKPEWDNGDGTTRGEVWFSYGLLDEDQPKGLLISYGKPRFEGKGGACGVEYREEVIASQRVAVCEDEEFKAEYFIHPTKKAEYGVYIKGVSDEQMTVLKEAVRKTLQFN